MVFGPVAANDFHMAAYLGKVRGRPQIEVKVKVILPTTMSPRARKPAKRSKRRLLSEMTRRTMMLVWRRWKAAEKKSS